MSKLNGVKTVDMANGEVTKVTYDGAEYVKFDGKARVSDLIQPNSGWKSCESGQFYVCIEIDDEYDARIETEQEYISSNYRSKYEVFRKVNAKPSEPTEQLQVGDTVKVSIPDGQRPAYGWGGVKNDDTGKVIAVFTNSVTVDFPAHNSWTARLTELVKVAEDGYVRVTERKPKAGDYVKFTELTEDFEDCFSLGKYYEITEIDDWEDPQIIGDEGNSYDTAGDDFEVYELVGTNPEALTFKGAEYTLVQRKAQPGDVVVFTENTSVCFDNGKTYGPIDEDLKVEFSSEFRAIVYRNEYDRTVDNVKVFAPVAEAETLKEAKLKVGDYAKVTNYDNGHQRSMKDGDIVKITETDRSSGFTTGAKRVSDDYYEVYAPNQLVKATDADIAKVLAPKFSVGDYAKVIGGTYNNDIQFGNLVKITRELDEDGEYKIRLLDDSDYDYAKPEALEKVSVEDLAEAKLAEQFTKLGRKPNEFKNGDIAKVIDSPSASPNGTLIEITAVYDAHVIGRGWCAYLDKVTSYGYGLNGHIELIAPVESRVDRQ